MAYGCHGLRIHMVRLYQHRGGPAELSNLCILHFNSCSCCRNSSNCCCSCIFLRIVSSSASVSVCVAGCACVVACVTTITARIDPIAQIVVPIAESIAAIGPNVRDPEQFECDIALTSILIKCNQFKKGCIFKIFINGNRRSRDGGPLPISCSAVYNGSAVNMKDLA